MGNFDLYKNREDPSRSNISFPLEYSLSEFDVNDCIETNKIAASSLFLFV